MAIDCHCHVIDPARFPFRADSRYFPSGHEIAPFEPLRRMMDQHGVSHALLVGTNSGYGEDSSPVLDAIDRGEGRFRGVAVVALDIDTAALAALKAHGIVGVAFNAPFHSPEYYGASTDLLRRLVDLDMFLNLQVKGDQLLHFLDPIERVGVRLVVDHCGRPDPALGLNQPGFAALLSLGRAGRAAVKLSGFSQFSHERYPFADTHPFIRALLEAFLPQRCVWGSDWPFLRATERTDYGPLLQLFESLIPDAVVRRQVLQHTSARLFGFSSGLLP